MLAGQPLVKTRRFGPTHDPDFIDGQITRRPSSWRKLSDQLSGPRVVDTHVERFAACRSGAERRASLTTVPNARRRPIRLHDDHLTRITGTVRAPTAL